MDAKEEPPRGWWRHLDWRRARLVFLVAVWVVGCICLAVMVATKHWMQVCFTRARAHVLIRELINQAGCSLSADPMPMCWPREGLVGGCVAELSELEGVTAPARRSHLHRAFLSPR
jgi:hypothetical protein